MNITTDHCSECNCYIQETCVAGFHPLVGDGFCNDETNNQHCSYDRGDCCLLNVTKDNCTECNCYIQETCEVGFHPLVGDGFCNDELNIASCYDHGDCCLFNANTDLCSNCSCSENGIITSSGFPQNYNNNIDLTWIIQVSLGQVIEVEFVSFILENHYSCR